ncbi:CinA family protein [Ornithinimicrobium cerasi]|uniref:Nicotinamide-nucleotide amidase n=1 Tax=Ornithinimicrobium cerasi TaxID=2248773 RepID=A0A285VQA0_9MICO|nr:nicotinamide-nucleotide amidohydrolase family protein [Ornithinimicrobium cerasi]SOC55416.1 nicotinamide-nucleotide amidase [Ornithinimicrobium cerasi]
MSAAAARVVDLLREAGQTVATAESLTGGLVTGALTDVPGSSDVLVGAVVAYAPEVKVRLLDVPAELLAVEGVVSQACAEAMADGVRRLLGTDWGVATTGVAGPGPSDGHPAGTVHVAVVGESGRVHRALHLDGDRDTVRSSTVELTLRLLEGVLLSVLSVPGGTVEVSELDVSG